MLYREANPGKFNNRVRNKMYYTQVWCFKTFQTVIHIYEDQTWLNNYQAGGLDLLKAKWKKLSEYATNTLTAVNLGNIKTFQLSGMSALNVTVRTSLPSWKNTRYKIGPLKLCWDVRVFMSIVFFVIFFYVIVGALGALPEHPLLWIWHSTVELRQRSTEDGRRALWGLKLFIFLARPSTFTNLPCDCLPLSFEGMKISARWLGWQHTNFHCCKLVALAIALLSAGLVTKISWNTVESWWTTMYQGGKSGDHPDNSCSSGRRSGPTQPLHHWDHTFEQGKDSESD